MNLAKVSFSICMLLLVLNIHAQHGITEAPSKPDFGNGVINPEFAAKAEGVVEQWFEALVYNDTLQLKKLTGFPFAWVGWKLFLTKEYLLRS